MSHTSSSLSSASAVVLAPAGRPARHRLIATLLVAGAVVVNVAFAGLGSVFDYPDVLNHPAAEVLATFHDKQGAVSGLFLLLAIGAGLMAPIAVSVGRLGSSRLLRASVVVGVAAAVVQVVACSAGHCWFPDSPPPRRTRPRSRLSTRSTSSSARWSARRSGTR